MKLSSYFYRFLTSQIQAFDTRLHSESNLLFRLWPDDRAGGWEMEEGQENILGARLLEALSHRVEPQLDSEPGCQAHLPTLLLHPRCLRQDLILLRKEFLRSILRSGFPFLHTVILRLLLGGIQPWRLREKASTCFANPHRSWGCWEQDEAPVASCKRKNVAPSSTCHRGQSSVPRWGRVRQRGGDRTL